MVCNTDGRSVGAVYLRPVKAEYHWCSPESLDSSSRAMTCMRLRRSHPCPERLTFSKSRCILIACISARHWHSVMTSSTDFRWVPSKILKAVSEIPFKMCRTHLSLGMTLFAQRRSVWRLNLGLQSILVASLWVCGCAKYLFCWVMKLAQSGLLLHWSRPVS